MLINNSITIDIMLYSSYWDFSTDHAYAYRKNEYGRNKGPKKKKRKKWGKNPISEVEMSRFLLPKRYHGN